MTKLSVIILSLFLCSAAIAQDKYFVVFKDKKNVTFNPYDYFDQKAIDRRRKLNLPLDHFTDRPLNQTYISSLTPYTDSIGRQLRWINAVVAFIEPHQLAKIEMFDHVSSVIPMGEYSADLASYEDLGQGELILAKAQIERMNGHAFRDAELTGEGVRIAILDAGFPGVLTLENFKHIRTKKRLIAHYDFVKDEPETYKGNKHGTMVLSNIAGKIGEIDLGMATDAEFLLARTESGFKGAIIGEENWLAAVEWADKNGADIINSSLGYTKRNYFRSDMDGQTSMISAAANMAARKGILVIVSAGNEGKDKDWINIASPADADSVLAVGGINPWTNMHNSWSSYGPSSDGRIKPNICAYGNTMVAYSGGLQEVQGTSFASPLIAGFAACAWQSDTTLTNMDLFRKIEMSGELYPYYDYAHGYGVPQSDPFLNDSNKQQDTTFHIIVDSINVFVRISETDFSRSTLVMHEYYNPNNDRFNFNPAVSHGDHNIMMTDPAFIHHNDDQYQNTSTGIRSDKCDYFFYHISNASGQLSKYFVIGVEQHEVLKLPFSAFESGDILRCYYKGFSNTYKF